MRENFSRGFLGIQREVLTLPSVVSDPGTGYYYSFRGEWKSTKWKRNRKEKEREGLGKKGWRYRNYSVLTKLCKVEFH